MGVNHTTLLISEHLTKLVAIIRTSSFTSNENEFSSWYLRFMSLRKSKWTAMSVDMMEEITMSRKAKEGHEEEEGKREEVRGAADHRSDR